jgi:ketosteroid isomerase-like protein
MSQENVEAVRKTVDAFNRGDFDAALEPAHPDVEWVTLDSFPDAGTHRGPEGLRQFFATWMDMFQGFRLHLEDCVALDQDLVLATVRVSGEGTESGVQVESPIFFQLVHFRDGLAIRVQMFHTKSEALEAAGVGDDTA